MGISTRSLAWPTPGLARPGPRPRLRLRGLTDYYFLATRILTDSGILSDYRAFQQEVSSAKGFFTSSGQVDERKRLLLILERLQKVFLRARARLMKEKTILFFLAPGQVD